MNNVRVHMKMGAAEFLYDLDSRTCGPRRIVREVSYPVPRGTPSRFDPRRTGRQQVVRNFDYSLLPEHLQGGMRLYIEHGILPGDFLQAVLRNDFADAVGRADASSFFAMPMIAAFMRDEMPPAAWGSEAKVKAWKGIPRNGE